MKRLFHLLGSLRITVALLAASMALVFFGTFDQTHWGIRVVQKEYFESLFVAYPLDPDAWTTFPGIGTTLASWGLRIPMPGGFLIGGLLILNLFAAHFRYFKPSWKKSGIAVTHAGVLLLIVSGFATAALQKESMTIIPQGGKANWAADADETEIALTDLTDPKEDRVTVIPEALLRDGNSKGLFQVPKSAIEIRIRQFFPNAPVIGPQFAKDFPNLEPVKVDNGVAARVKIQILPQKENFSPNARNSPSAIIEIVDAGKSAGTWLLNADLTSFSGLQTFRIGDREYGVELRPKRTYFPFSLRLDKFSHDKYPGTQIPSNFSSDITIFDPAEPAPRPALIRMNQPLRHGGLTFYQASFDTRNGVTSTALQTVRNPSYMLPYLAVALVGAGLLIQFGLSLVRFVESASAKKEKVSE